MITISRTSNHQYVFYNDEIKMRSKKKTKKGEEKEKNRGKNTKKREKKSVVNTQHSDES